MTIEIYKKILKRLALANGVSGREDNIAGLIEEYFEEFCDEVSMDRNGNIIGVKKSSNPNAVNIMLDAHYDEIGLVVTKINDNGFLSVTDIGGVDTHILLGNEVTVHGRNPLYGVICCMPPHLSGSEDKKILKTNEIFIDIGFDAKTARELVEPGDFISFRSSSRELLNNRLTSKSLDDRAGVAALIACGKYLENESLNYNVYYVASVQEETGHCGAAVASYAINPAYAIAVDVTYGETPDAPEERVCKISGGAAIGISPLLNYSMSQKLISLAEINSIPYQIEVMGSRTFTNADDIHFAHQGVKTALLSIPLKYMHSTVELLQVEDIDAAAKLMSIYIKAGLGL